MKLLSSFLLILFTVSIGIAQPKEQALAGTWYIPKQKADINIYKQDDVYVGEIIKGYNDPPLLDFNNNDAQERRLPLVGKFILSNMKFQNGQLVDGSIYNPENGKTYNCQIELVEEGKLKVTGFVGLLFFGKTQYWYRTKKS